VIFLLFIFISTTYIIKCFIYLCFFYLCGGTLGTAAITGLLYQPRMIGDCGEIGGIKIGRGNRSTRRKPAPASLCPPQSHMTRPDLFVLSFFLSFRVTFFFPNPDYNLIRMTSTLLLWISECSL
jgi:hypothetical protein